MNSLKPEILNMPNGFPHTGVLTNEQLIVTTTTGSAAIWRLPFDKTQQLTFLTGGNKDYPSGFYKNACVSPDSNWLLTFSQDEAFLWDLRKTIQGIKPVNVFKGEPNGINGYWAAWAGAIFSKNNEWLALVQKRDRYKGKKDIGGPLNTVTLINLKSTNQISRQFPFDNDNTFNIIRFSNDGKWLATGGKDDMSRFSEQTGVQLWNLANNDWGKNPISLLAHNSSVNDFRFSIDGNALFSSSLDRSIIKWQLTAADPARAFIFLQAPTDIQFLSITSLFPSIDGTTLIAATKYGESFSSEYTTVDKWQLTAESIKSDARRIVNRNLSIQEWRRYFGNLPYEKAFNELP